MILREIKEGSELFDNLNFAGHVSNSTAALWFVAIFSLLSNTWPC